MRLNDWRIASGKTLGECAVLLGLSGARTYHRYETGENRVDADLVDVIIRVTDGAVTAVDMHTTRLDWLKVNRPERFVPEAAE